MGQIFKQEKLAELKARKAALLTVVVLASLLGATSAHAYTVAPGWSVTDYVTVHDAGVLLNPTYPTVTLGDPYAAASMLNRMQRPATARLDPALARDIANTVARGYIEHRRRSAVEGLQRLDAFYKGRENEPHVKEVFQRLGEIYFDATQYPEASVDGVNSPCSASLTRADASGGSTRSSMAHSPRRKRGRCD